MIDAFSRPIHFGLTRTTDAPIDAIDVMDAKDWLRVTHDSEDVTIAALIAAARVKVEDDTGIGIGLSTWTWTLDATPRSLRVPVGPLQSVTSITSHNESDSNDVVAASVYRVDAESLPGRIVLKNGQSWPSSLRPEGGLTVIFVAGFSAPNSVPTPLRLAMRLLVEHWFSHRGVVATPGQTGTELPRAYGDLVEPYRLRVVM